MFEIKIKNSSEKILLKDMPTMRQAFFVASMLILGGFLLAHYIHPYFLALPVLVGFGLLFSSLVGFCPMLLIVQAMPWNKKKEVSINNNEPTI